MADTRTQIAAVLFRPAPGGYVYREPYRWPFGEAPHYLVNEDQKAAIMEITLSKRPILSQVILWGTLCAMVALACVVLWAITGHDTPTGIDTILMIVLTVAQIILALAILFWWKRRRMRPLLATLPLTDLRINHSEMRAAATNAMSVKQLVITGVASVVASTAMLVSGIIQLVLRQPTGFIWFGCSFVFAVLAYYYFKQLIARTEKL
jgi:bacteriorhodopsin